MTNPPDLPAPAPPLRQFSRQVRRGISSYQTAVGANGPSLEVPLAQAPDAVFPVFRVIADRANTGTIWVGEQGSQDLELAAGDTADYLDSGPADIWVFTLAGTAGSPSTQTARAQGFGNPDVPTIVAGSR